MQPLRRQAKLMSVGKTLALTVLLCGPLTAAACDARWQFFSELRKLCGARFEGASTFPDDPKHDFAGKRLVAVFAHCSDNEVRIPFAVGEDRSRTWLIRWQAGQLSLKHDHRHADGSPDAVTMYGGAAAEKGTGRVQAFAADAYTAELIPAAATNVWTLSLSDDGKTLTYHLDRDGKPRYEAVLQRVPSTP